MNPPRYGSRGPCVLRNGDVLINVSGSDMAARVAFLLNSAEREGYMRGARDALAKTDPPAPAERDTQRDVLAHLAHEPEEGPWT